MYIDLEAASPADRLAIARWIVESPETVLAVAALLRGVGRAWLAGDLSSWSCHQLLRSCGPDSRVNIEAAEAGRVFGATRRGEVVGHGSSLAAGDVYADISVHVAEAHRREGLATAAASLACRAVQRSGLTPVWGTSSTNAASLGVARKLGFVTVARRTYLVRGEG